MLAAVKQAKNIAKPVQALLADAIDAFSQPIAACNRAQYVAELVHEYPPSVVPPETLAPRSHENLDKGVFAEIKSISSRLTDQGKQISAITEAITSGTGVAGQWNEVVKRKMHLKKTGGDAAPPITGEGLGLPTGVSPNIRTPRARPPCHFRQGQGRFLLGGAENN